MLVYMCIINMYVYVHISLCMCNCVYVCKHICVYMYMCMCVMCACLCEYMCEYACVCTQHMYMSDYVHVCCSGGDTVMELLHMKERKTIQNKKENLHHLKFFT